MTRSLAGALVLTALTVLLGAAPAGATDPLDAPSSAPTPPAPDRAALDALDAAPDAVPGARREAPCPSPTPPSGTGFGDLPPGPDPADAWVDGRGEGQLVAVVDTGVAAHPRLAGRVVDGGDFVAGASGLDDCDGHGTAVAGVIAASPAPDDLVVGRAPAARVLAVRQTSAFFGVDGRAGVGDVTSLARAVRHAADTPGVGVLTLALTACRTPAEVTDPSDAPALGALRAAVRDAVDRGVVVVAAAGNTGPACAPNTGGPVRSVPVPAWFGDDVLAVGAVDDAGAPDPSSLAGPWVDLAAPGREPSSLAARGPGLTTTLGAPDGSSGPLVGTSFAAARVAAAAALLRQRSPETPAREIAAALVRSAAPPPGLTPGVRDDAVGYGVLDAAAAVRGGPPRTGPEVRPEPPAPPTEGPATGWITAAVGAVAAVVAVGAVAARRRRGGAW
ncbi:type VII secretion-associated serine protease mycosin [Actinomycetospora callitridis]|uniref:type VII secretion-associated serine protease mycosin n=1 Tax=Actinomycetospora callitridis TaxID=913944 RepID=UPI0023664469|nr:type VII secretion-associated serine protease mycosin [Actinomycetospora callitridis]MDD7917899.1 type VII secretion-associated serine protease mycosin [Actinomycetospora callitridis]